MLVDKNKQLVTQLCWLETPEIPPTVHAYVIFVHYIAAQAERIGIQLIFGEKGEEALMRMRAPAGILWICTGSMVGQNKDSGAEKSYVHSRKSTAAYTHTQLFIF